MSLPPKKETAFFHANLAILSSVTKLFGELE
jgi:hypothetical protein